jgi:hypothetical protein
VCLCVSVCVKQPLYDEAIDSIRQLADDLDLAKQMFADMLQTYAEPADSNSDEIFGGVHRFFVAFKVHNNDDTSTHSSPESANAHCLGISCSVYHRLVLWLRV